MNRRRLFGWLLALGVSMAGLVTVRKAGLHSAPVPRRVGFLYGSENEFAEAFRQGLRDYGWVEGHNISVERRP